MAPIRREDVTLERWWDSLGLPRGGTVLTNDDRPISMISWDDAHGSLIRVRQGGVTEIVAYDEKAELGLVPWIAVIHGRSIRQRVPAYQVTVVYFADGGVVTDPGPAIVGERPGA